MQKEFFIPVTFEMCGMIAIKADSAEDAIKKAQDHIDELPVPCVNDYVDGSYKVETNPEIVELYSTEEEKKNHYPDRISL